VPALAAVEKALAFAAAFFRLADADVIEVAKPKTMHGEAPAADLTGNLLQDIVSGLLTRCNTKDPNAIRVQGPDHSDGASRLGLRGRDLFHAGDLGKSRFILG
jgi:hypothetical protein